VNRARHDEGEKAPPARKGGAFSGRQAGPVDDRPGRQLRGHKLGDVPERARSARPALPLGIRHISETSLPPANPSRSLCRHQSQPVATKDITRRRKSCPVLTGRERATLSRPFKVRRAVHRAALAFSPACAWFRRNCCTLRESFDSGLSVLAHGASAPAGHNLNLGVVT